MSERDKPRKVTFSITVNGIGSCEAEPGQNLRAALRREGVYIDGTCSDNGTCGRCAVRVVAGDTGRPSEQEEVLLGQRSLDKEHRLACRIKVKDDLKISIDPERILEIDRAGRWKETWDSPLWSPGRIETDHDGYGIAVDLGTSSIASGLLSLATGRPLDIKSTANPQTPWGEDVLSRLAAADADTRTAEKLGHLAWQTVRDHVRSLCLRNGISAGRITRVVVVGNSAMHHLALGLPAGDLLLPPHSPSRSSAMSVTPDDLPMDTGLGRHCEIYFPPLAGGFAGSDCLASLLAAVSTGCVRGLVVDAGTNTEVAVWNRDLVAVATAPSGPAFEGGHIAHGMRAEEGAIWRVDIRDNAVNSQVIGGGRAKGICGTGLVDAIASMLEKGILDRSGLLVDRSHPMLQNGVFTVDTGGSVALSGQDVATFQKAKSAVFCAIEILLGDLNLAAGKLDTAYLAGSFGSRLNTENAIRAGLLPPISPGRYTAAGNTALVGASMALASAAMRQKAEDLALQIRHIDLAQDPRFEDLFIENLAFKGF